MSCHYHNKTKLLLIIQNGKNKDIAWHAGKSKWKNFNNLNDKSIGIEIVIKATNMDMRILKKQIKSL